MGIFDDLADNLAKDTIAASEKLNDPKLIEDVAEQLKALHKQAALINEAGIEATARNSHAIQQHRQRRGVIALRPKKRGGLAQSGVAVELEWSRHGMLLGSVLFGTKYVDAEH